MNSSPKNNSQWLTEATQQLASAGIQTARLDALILLEDSTGHYRAWLLAHTDESLSDAQLQALSDQLTRRAQHEPLAYIRGHAEFYGRDFIVNKNVLVPRPESEDMIELLKKIAIPGDQVADIGTGCGALAITAALETSAVVSAVDIDEACLAVARRNAVQHTATITWLLGDLLAPLTQNGGADILLCNLPYVPTNYSINRAAKHEPGLALFGGEDGLDLYRRLFAQTAQLPQAPRAILTESLPEQHDVLIAIAAESGYRLQQTAGFIQLFSR